MPVYRDHLVSRVQCTVIYIVNILLFYGILSGIMIEHRISLINHDIRKCVPLNFVPKVWIHTLNIEQLCTIWLVNLLYYLINGITHTQSKTYHCNMGRIFVLNNLTTSNYFITFQHEWNRLKMVQLQLQLFLFNCILIKDNWILITSSCILLKLYCIN